MHKSNMMRGNKSQQNSRCTHLQVPENVKRDRKHKHCLENRQAENFALALQTLTYDHKEFFSIIKTSDDAVDVLEKFYIDYPLCNYHLKPVNKKTPVWYAASVGNTKIVEFLVRKGADFNTASALDDIENKGINDHQSCGSKASHHKVIFLKSFTPLMIAAHRNHFDVVDFLLAQEGINVNYIDPENQVSTLHLAIILKNIRLVKSLLNHKDIKLDSKDDVGRSILIWAMKYENYEIIKLILEKIKAKATSGEVVWDEIINVKVRRPVQEAASANRKEASNSKKPLKTDSIVPLIMAVMCGSFESVKLLLDYGADPNLRDEICYATPLITAISCMKDMDMANLLIQRGADVRKRDINEVNALYYALTKFPIETSIALVEHILKASDDPLKSLCPRFELLFPFLLVKYYQSSDVPVKNILEKVVKRMVSYTAWVI